MTLFSLQSPVFCKKHWKYFTVATIKLGVMLDCSICPSICLSACNHSCMLCNSYSSFHIRHKWSLYWKGVFCLMTTLVYIRLNTMRKFSISFTLYIIIPFSWKPNNMQVMHNLILSSYQFKFSEWLNITLWTYQRYLSIWDMITLFIYPIKVHCIMLCGSMSIHLSVRLSFRYHLALYQSNHSPD